MRIICPYVAGGLREQTRDALLTHARHLVEWRELPADDPRAYGELVLELWERREAFAIVEQDIVIRADVVEAFITCEAEYCAFPYAWVTNVGPALGCTRFGKPLMDIFSYAAQDAVAKNVAWDQFDVIFQRHILVRKYDQQPCVHLPAVEHLNEAKKLRPDGVAEPLMSLPAW